MSRYSKLKETLPTYSEADDYLQVIGPEPDHDDSCDLVYELISIEHPLYHRYTSNNWRKTHNLPLNRTSSLPSLYEQQLAKNAQLTSQTRRT